MTRGPWWMSALLRLYPRDYRDRHEAELSSAMQACIERERHAGASPTLTATRIALDAITSALLVRRDSRGRRHAYSALSTQHQALSTGDPLMQSLLYDARYAVRHLSRAPLFSALVIATLALAIGANTAIFSVVNGVLLRGLPYSEPERLVLLYEGLGAQRPFGFSAPDFAGFCERARSYDGIAAYRNEEFELSGIDQPERVNAAKISASLMDVLGTPPALGRPFTIEEDTGRQPAAILSDGLWRRKFGADSAIVGKPVLPRSTVRSPSR